MTGMDVYIESDNKTLAAALVMCEAVEVQPLDVLRMTRKLVAVMEWRVERCPHSDGVGDVATVCASLIGRLSHGKVSVTP